METLMTAIPKLCVARPGDARNFAWEGGKKLEKCIDQKST
jgi:hypothetical protein